ncbi:hypothetical protein MRB53_022741 [Persea americana]|uniref:Uncharacterized protein n=1 Tax=Persea americana TaxID=3435 RepID=A0ACC2L8F6_PERAE|nr:hypothetical protein MRB53_022741 [Persea americana]
MDSNSSLPQDIIFDILSRLPVENLIPLCSLSKQWSNLIYNPSFVNAHTQHVTPKPVFIFQSSNINNTIIAIDMETGKKKAFNFKPENDYSDCLTAIHASCNGLILLETQQDFYVYNPITRRSVALPRLARMADESFCLWSLAYVATTNKYKVVCGTYGSECYECHIVTVGEECDSWRTVKIPTHCLFAFPPVYANGSLHWMIYSMEIEKLDGEWSQLPQSEGRLLTMDIAREVFHTRVHPQCFSGVYTLLEMDGVLCFADHIRNNQLKIWSLKDLEKQEWEEVCCIELGDVLPFGGFLLDTVPVAIFSSPELKIIIKCFDDFFSYEVEFKRLQHLTLDIEWKPGISKFEEQFSPFRSSVKVDEENGEFWLASKFFDGGL